MEVFWKEYCAMAVMITIKVSFGDETDELLTGWLGVGINGVFQNCMHSILVIVSPEPVQAWVHSSMGLDPVVIPRPCRWLYCDAVVSFHLCKCPP